MSETLRNNMIFLYLSVLKAEKQISSKDSFSQLEKNNCIAAAHLFIFLSVT